jgi:hypothetical protein
MLRQFVCGLACLALIAGAAAADKKEAKKGKTVAAAFESFKDGVLTVKVQAGKGEEGKSQEYRLGDDVTVFVVQGNQKTQTSPADGFKDLKSGTQVVLKLGEDDKVTGVQVRMGKKAKAKKLDK